MVTWKLKKKKKIISWYCIHVSILTEIKKKINKRTHISFIYLTHTVLVQQACQVLIPSNCKISHTSVSLVSVPATHWSFVLVINEWRGQGADYNTDWSQRRNSAYDLNFIRYYGTDLKYVCQTNQTTWAMGPPYKYHFCKYNMTFNINWTYIYKH